jgi:hypothetical protein
MGGDLQRTITEGGRGREKRKLRRKCKKMAFSFIL